MKLFKSEENCTQNTKATRTYWREEEQKNGQKRKIKINRGLCWSWMKLGVKEINSPKIESITIETLKITK